MIVHNDVTGRRARRRFSREWPDFVRGPVTEALVARAEAVKFGLPGKGLEVLQIRELLIGS